MLKSISHIALAVADPARTISLFCNLFDAQVVDRVDDEGHRETFLKLGGIWIVVVASAVRPARTGDHIAFLATPAVLENTVAKLEAMGREYIRARSNRALYFFDYDDHVFELDVEDLEEELGT
jgi:catechol 2,3-dioxygenase-like lactoylglutathione lyase family enzyme